MIRQNIAAALSATGPLSSRLHLLSKDQAAAEQFWSEVERIAALRQGDLTNITAGQRVAVLTEIAHQAFDRVPAARHASMAGYLWHLLDANAKATFKVSCRNLRTPAGRADMADFVAYLERNEALNYAEECRGKPPVTKDIASRLMMEWLLSR